MGLHGENFEVFVVKGGEPDNDQQMAQASPPLAENCTRSGIGLWVEQCGRPSLAKFYIYSTRP